MRENLIVLFNLLFQYLSNFFQEQTDHCYEKRYEGILEIDKPIPLL